MKKIRDSRIFQNASPNIFSQIFRKINVIERLWSIRHHLKIQVTTLGGREIRIVTPVYKRSEEIILFFQGGNSIQYSAGKQRKTISGTSGKTGATVIVPDLWSFPELTQEEAIDFLGDLYCNFFVGQKDSKIIFVGDHAGKDLAEDFAQKLRNERVCSPNKIILLSALPDVNSSEPDIIKKTNAFSFSG
jgi:acetyl esterase/lipase